MEATMLQEVRGVMRSDPGLSDEAVRQVLDALDLGVVLCDAGLTRVRYANAEGARALAALGAARGRLPGLLRDALGAALPVGRFQRAVAVATPRGRRYFARAQRIPAPVDGALLVVTLACLRHVDRVALVRRRLGLPPRLSECVALIRDGLSNLEIAARLSVTEGTVSQYLVRIYERLGVRRRSDLVALVDDETLTGEPGKPWE